MSVLSENIEMLKHMQLKNKVSEYVKQNLIEMKGEIGKSTSYIWRLHYHSGSN